MTGASRLRRLALCAAALSAATLAGSGALGGQSREQGSGPVTELDGHDWVELTLEQKERLVAGFALGWAARQARGDSAPAAGDSSGVDGRALGRTIAELRARGELELPFAPALLARRVDEFYWWRNNRDVTVAGALAEIAERLRRQNR